MGSNGAGKEEGGKKKKKGLYVGSLIFPRLQIDQMKEGGKKKGGERLRSCFMTV